MPPAAALDILIAAFGALSAVATIVFIGRWASLEPHARARSSSNSVIAPKSNEQAAHEPSAKD